MAVRYASTPAGQSRPLRPDCAPSAYEQPTLPTGGLDPLLNIDELAEYLGVPIRTIYDWRQTGNGPRGTRVGRQLKFAVSDVMAWIDCQREATTGRDAAKG